jgi:hypothetical protein
MQVRSVKFCTGFFCHCISRRRQGKVTLSLWLINHPEDVWGIGGRAVAQQLDAGFPPRRSGFASGVCGGQSGAGAGFLRVLRFPLPIIPPISPLS